jgi:hypothetical protein
MQLMDRGRDRSQRSDAQIFSTFCEEKRGDTPWMTDPLCYGVSITEAWVVWHAVQCEVGGQTHFLGFEENPEKQAARLF